MRSPLTVVFSLIVPVITLGCQGGSTPATPAAEIAIPGPEATNTIGAENADDGQPHMLSKRHHFRTPLAHHHIRHRQPFAR